MSEQPTSNVDSPPAASSSGRHIALQEPPAEERYARSESGELTDSKGWDGRARVATLENPEALEDSGYSDVDNVLEGEEIAADENILDGEDPEVEDIALPQSRVRSIAALNLGRFKKVRSLCLRQNQIQKLEGLDELAETLVELDVYDNLIKHMGNLDKLVNLTDLDLSFNKFKHIKNLETLTKLEKLYFVGNKISVIENLQTLVNIRSLELGSNRIREIQNLQALQNLEELWLGKNKITSLEGLSGLPKLGLLSIQSNRIVDLSPLKNVPSLRELYISHNAVVSLEGLENNTAITVLDISHNPIRSLKGVGPLKELEDVWASYCHIMDFAELDRELRDKEKLRTVYFEGNGLQLKAPPLYRNKVRLALPQVTQIDATFVR